MSENRTDTEQRETTSIKVKPSLWKEAKIEAIKQDKQISELVEEAIQEWMKKHGKGR
jgi:predicted HicB family RNase H-like nuclease